jgi:chromosome segregation ATPase
MWWLHCATVFIFYITTMFNSKRNISDEFRGLEELISELKSKVTGEVQRNTKLELTLAEANARSNFMQDLVAELKQQIEAMKAREEELRQAEKLIEQKAVELRIEIKEFELKERETLADLKRKSDELDEKYATKVLEYQKTLAQERADMVVDTAKKSIDFIANQ